MTLKLEGVLGILKIYHHTENEDAILQHSKLELELKQIQKCLKIKGQGQSVQKLRITSSVIVTDIPIKP